MSAITKNGKFTLVEAAVLAGIAPQPAAASFDDLSELQAKSLNPGRKFVGSNP
jgi:hypothetical protein